MNSSRILKIAALPSEHVFKMNISSDGKVTPLGGVEFRLLNLLAKCVHFQYEVVIPPDREFGRKKDDGTWSGMVGMASRGEVDFALNMIALTSVRHDDVDFAYPYYVDRTTFFTKIPALLPRFLAFFYPFDMFLWACLIFVLILAPFIFKYLLGKRSLSKLYFEIFGSFFQQPFNIKIPKFSQRLLCASWLFYTRFTILCYSVLLLSFLTVPLVSPGIHTVNEVAGAAAKGTYKCYVFGGTADQDAFYSATSGPLHIIGETVKKYNRLVKHGGHIEQYIPDAKTILIGSNILVPFNYMGGAYQNYFTSKDIFYITLFGIPVKKDFCCLKKMNKCILRTFESGMYQKFLKDDLYDLHFNSLSNQTRDDETLVLGFDDLGSAFLIHFIGNVVAVFCFTFEMCCCKKQSKKDHSKKKKRKSNLKRPNFN